MAEQKFEVKCGFFDSVNQDRLYTANEMNRPYKRVVSNGVFATPAGTPSTDLQVLSAGNGMNIIVKKGEGIFGDKWFENPSDLTLTVSPNTGTTPRRDSIIVQVDKRTVGRIGNIVYREGTPSSNPQPPAIGTVTNVIEYRIANIYVARGATAINQDAIVDLRGSSECPWVTSLIKQVDTSELFRQWQTAYENYYASSTQSWEDFVRNLTDDLTVATNIIMYESHYTTSTDGQTTIPINIPAYDKTKDVLQVYVNRLRATPNIDYTLSADGKSITLTKDLNAGQSVNFLCLQSVVSGDLQSTVALIQNLNTRISELHSDSNWINFTLENGATTFDSTTTPAVRKYGNQVYIRGAIKNLNTVNVPIATLPTNMRPAMNHQYSVTAFADNTIAANCVIEVKTNGQITLVAKSGTIPSTAMLPISTQFILG